MHTLKYCLSLAVALLMAHNGVAQKYERQTYTMEKPYQVEKITPPKGKKVKNVILMIGDGMSLMNMYSLWTCNRGHLWMENAQYTGLSKTYCANKLITDSGAGGTAIATGHKTNYHSVGVDVNGKALQSLCGVARQKGKKTGIAVTCRLWDATPADFACHNTDRNNSQDIIADYAECDVDYVFGGGAQQFQNRKDGRDIFSELTAKGYHVSRTLADLWQQKSGRVFAVPYDVDTPLPDERGDLLAKAAMKGLDLLSGNKKGFFMMIEGSQLDDYGHENKLDMLMKETADFDRTVGEMMKWAAADGETLVVVTADHETGGLTLLDGNLAEGRIVCKFSTQGHSGVMVPVYAFGPGSENFTGFMENADIFWKIKKLMK